MARYLVGTGSNCWNFTDAYNAAKNGDIIEFDKGYTYELPSFSVQVIEKDLHFVGHVEKKEGNSTFHNVLNAYFDVTNGAKVTFENLWFKTSDNRVALSVTNGADVFCTNIYFEEQILNNEKFLLYASNNAKLHLNEVGMKVVNGSTTTVGVFSSELIIENSRILGQLDLEQGSRMMMNSVHLEHYTKNAICATDSRITVKSSTIKGGNTQNNLPLIWLENVVWASESTSMVQPNYINSINLSENVLFSSQNDRITSINTYSSQVYLEQTTITDIILLNEKSFGVFRGEINFLGNNSEKIDLELNDNSAIFADCLVLHRSVEPNCRVSSSSYLQIKNLSYPEGDIADLNYEISDDSKYVLETSEVQIQPKENENNALEELNNLVGLDKVKQEIKKMVRMVDFNKKRIEKGLPPEKQTLHSVFMGNPGTGKTTVARLLGEVLYQNGVLSGDSFRFVEATESDLISSNVGGTAEQTQRLLEKAKGGILFIDEAYTLHKKQGVDHGIEAINTILKYMEDNRDNIMIIFAGYTKEMEQFLQTNPGLKSRVPNTFIFEDYSDDEIVQLGKSFLAKGGYKLENSGYYAQHVKRAYDVSLDKSNGRWIRNLNEKLVKTFAARVNEQDSEDIETIMNVDIDAVFEEDKYKAGVDGQEDAMVTLDNLIGISKVKEQVKQFIDMAEFNKKRAEQGGTVDDTTLHSLFLGNPGTGKTTVARIVGSILYQKGVISQNKFIEVSRSDLVGGYIGHTAIKTKEVLESALGGVLFIDEAYTLSSGGANDFGKEAIDEILKFMEDHRGDIVIIFAGYTKEMTEFLETNSGLRSRIPTTFDFEDYTPEEIVQIGLLGLHKQDYEVNEALYAEVVTQNYSVTNDHSNGRWVRNLNERLLRHVSTRVNREESTDYNTITDQDIENVRER